METTGSVFLAEMLFSGLLLIGVAYGVARVFRHSPASVRHAGWALTFLGLLLLPLASALLPQWELPVRIPSPMQVGRQQSAQPASGSDAELEELEATPSGIEGLPPAEQEAQTLERKAPAEEGVRSTGGGIRGVPFSVWIVAVWGAGAFLLVGRLAARTLYLRRQVRSAEPARGWEDAFMRAKQKLGISRPVRLCLHSRIEMPCTIGALRPVILLPAEAEQWPSEKQQCVLLHELAHVRRWDYASHLMALVARCLHWPNPLAWMAARRLLIEREQACDDEVVQRGNLNPSAYSEDLLAVARGLLTEDRSGAGVLAMAHHTSELKARIEALLDSNRSRDALSKSRGLAMTAALVICLSLLSSADPVLSASGGEAAHRAPELQVNAQEAVRPDSLQAQTEGDASGQSAVKEPGPVISTEKKPRQPQKRVPQKNQKLAGKSTAKADTSLKEELQTEAVRALSELPSKEALPRLMQVARSHPNARIRLYAIMALGQKQNEAAPTFLASLVRNEENVEVAMTAVEALARQPSGSSVPLLIEIARGHPEQRVREAAVGELARSKNRQALSLLAEMARSGESREIRLRAIMGLAQSKDRQALETLAEIAKKEGDPEVRVQAIQGLSRASSDEVLEELIAVAKTPRGEEVRLYAIRALSEHDSPAALDALIEIAKTAESYEVQMTAVRGIGRRGNEQAAEVLMGILEQ